MARKKSIRLGDLQLRIMRVLWNGSSGVTVAEVQEQVEGTPLAYTTVATMLRKMEVRGLVTHREQGRKFLYEPAITPDDVSGGVSRDLVDRLFGGSLTGAVSHLLQSREVDSEELDELEALIRQHKRAAKRKL